MGKASIASMRKRDIQTDDPIVRAAVLARIYRKHVARQITGKVARSFDEILGEMLSALHAMHAEIDRNRLSEVGALLELTASSLHKAAHLSRKLNAISRATTYRTSSVDVNAVISSMTVLLRSMAGFEVECEFRLGRSLPNAYCDVGYLETLLFSLAFDAREAIEGRGKIVIETRHTRCDELTVGSRGSEGVLEISISDTGEIVSSDAVGAGLIDREKSPLPTVLQQRRVSITMAHDFVARLRGRVLVDQHPQCGTSVVLRLPCQAGEYGKPDLPRMQHSPCARAEEAESVYRCREAMPRSSRRRQAKLQEQQRPLDQCDLTMHACRQNTAQNAYVSGAAH